MHKNVYMSEISLIMSIAIHSTNSLVCHLQSSSVTADTTVLLIWPGDNTETPFTVMVAWQTAAPTLSTGYKQLQASKKANYTKRGRKHLKNTVNVQTLSLNFSV